MKRMVWLAAGVMMAGMTASAQAETDYLEAAAPPGWVFQGYQIYQHAEDFARDDTPLDDLNVDASVTLFRAARWWDKGVVHVIVPVVYLDQEGRVDAGGSQLLLFDSNKTELGDSYVGAYKRWTGENKDWWLLLGGDVRAPTGNYQSKDDPGCTHFQPFGGGGNLGTGSLSVQPTMIFSKLYAQGFFGHDTEARFDLNTSAGPVRYNPDDRLELWQTAHVGLAKNLRVGANFKGEYDIEDDDNDDDHAYTMAVGPGVMYMLGDIVIWGKVLFDVATNDAAEEFVLAYLRVSIPF